MGCVDQWKCGINLHSTTRIAAPMPIVYPMVRALPIFSCMLVPLLCHVNLPLVHFSIDNAKSVPQYLQCDPIAGSNWARGRKILKEALDGDKEKGCQEEEEKITRSGAKSPRNIKGK
jgi:hypothetical protein